MSRRLLLVGIVLTLIGFTFVNAQVTENAIILDNVDAPFIGQDSVFLNCGGELVFNLRIEVKEVEGTIGGVSNGFHVYEADPGDPTTPVSGTVRWTNIDAAFTNTTAWANPPFGLTLFAGVPSANPATGEGADTVGFQTAGIGTGIPVPPAGYSSIDWEITLDLVPDQLANDGRMICLDSVTTFGIGSPWRWLTPFGPMSENPTFSGPHCYTMVWSPIFSCGNVDCD
ncbi:hypothetical protein GF420_14190, partial [candidate division GN15 bacterium]|nr:hypothetical protein [candidate division GN15 bacterium]